jgi:hypothetical protein
MMSSRKNVHTRVISAQSVQTPNPVARRSANQPRATHGTRHSTSHSLISHSVPQPQNHRSAPPRPHQPFCPTNACDCHKFPDFVALCYNDLTNAFSDGNLNHQQRYELPLLLSAKTNTTRRIKWLTTLPGTEASFAELLVDRRRCRFSLRPSRARPSPLRSSPPTPLTMSSRRSVRSLTNRDRTTTNGVNRGQGGNPPGSAAFDLRW